MSRLKYRCPFDTLRYASAESLEKHLNTKHQREVVRLILVSRILKDIKTLLVL
jgi:hypothetical protein